MERLLNNVSRFATLLTRNPETEDLLNTLMRDFLNAQSVTAIEIQMIAADGELLMNSSVGLGIDGDLKKSVDSLSSLIHSTSIFSELENKGSIYNPANYLSITSVTMNSSIKGFYLFQHSSDFVPDEETADQLHAYSSLLTIYLTSKLIPLVLSKILTSPAITQHASKLTARQLLILTGMVEGKTNHELSIDLGFSVSTIRHETMAIYKELGVSDRKEAARVGQAESLI
jgi:DNA-binding CsgD family transcriptional regulator